MSKELTTMQNAFLEALFGEAKGNPHQAKKIAGYADSVKAGVIVAALRDEIVQMSKDILVLNGPKAALALVGILDEPNEGGAANKIKVAESILDRIGASAPKEDVNLKVPAGGLFIMPMKDADRLAAPKTIEGEVVNDA